MSSLKDLVVFAHSTFADRMMSDAEAESVSQLYGNKEELVAHVLLRMDYAKNNKSIRTSLRDMAARHVSSHRTQRGTYEDLASEAFKRSLAADAQKRFLTAVRAQSSIFDELRRAPEPWNISRPKRDGVVLIDTVIPRTSIEEGNERG